MSPGPAVCSRSSAQHTRQLHAAQRYAGPAVVGRSCARAHELMYYIQYTHVRLKNDVTRCRSHAHRHEPDARSPPDDAREPQPAMLPDAPRGAAVSLADGASPSPLPALANTMPLLLGAARLLLRTGASSSLLLDLLDFLAGAALAVPASPLAVQPAWFWRSSARAMILRSLSLYAMMSPLNRLMLWWVGRAGGGKGGGG